MALVELLLPPLAVHVRTARLVVVAAARRAGLEDGLVDEMRFAVGEACSRAVGLHTRHAPEQPVRITVEDGPTGLTVTVVDAGPEAGPMPGDVSAHLLEAASDPDPGDRERAGWHVQAADLPDDLVDPDLSLALLTGLFDATTVQAGPGGTTITLRWPLPVAVWPPGATALTHG